MTLTLIHVKLAKFVQPQRKRKMALSGPALSVVVVVVVVIESAMLNQQMSKHQRFLPVRSAGKLACRSTCLAIMEGSKYLLSTHGGAPAVRGESQTVKV